MKKYSFNDDFLNSECVVLRDTFEKWEKEFKNYKILYLYAHAGWGKTIDVKIFAKLYFKNHFYISVVDNDFFNKTKIYIENSLKYRGTRLIIIDDLAFLKDEDKRQDIIKLLTMSSGNSHTCCNIQFLLVSRCKLPTYLTPFFITKQLFVHDYTCLRFSKVQVMEYFEKLGIQDKIVPGTIEEVLKVSKGWILAIMLYGHFLDKGNMSVKDIRKDVQQGVFHYFDAALIPNWDNKMLNTLLKVAGFNVFDEELINLINEDNNGRELIDEMLQTGSFLERVPSKGYHIEDFFVRYLLYLQNKRLTKSEISNIYQKAALFYENKGDNIRAIEFYSKARDKRSISRLIIYNLDHIGGEIYTREIDEYLKSLDEKTINESPQLLAVKAMLYSAKMEIEKSEEYYEKLDKLYKSLNKEDGRYLLAKKNLLYLSIALPHRSIHGLVKIIINMAKMFTSEEISMQKINITGNMPSAINGGKDLCPWERHSKMIYKLMKEPFRQVLSYQAAGFMDIVMGESLYEKNNMSESFCYLTKGLSDANLNGTIEMEFAATGVMAKALIAEGSLEMAEGIIENFKKKVIDKEAIHLYPNIDTLMTNVALIKGDISHAEGWLKKQEITVEDKFYITERYNMLTKARVYIALGKELEALLILSKVQHYAEVYKRKYIHIEVLILQSIIFYRRNEEWNETFIQAIKEAYSYKFIRVIADNGIQVLDMLKAISKEQLKKAKISKDYYNSVEQAVKKQASLYPDYLNGLVNEANLTTQELQVLKLMYNGMKNGDIAKELDIKLTTVKYHSSNIYRKFGVKNRAAAIKIAHEKEII